MLAVLRGTLLSVLVFSAFELGARMGTDRHRQTDRQTDGRTDGGRDGQDS